MQRGRERDRSLAKNDGHQGDFTVNTLPALRDTQTKIATDNDSLGRGLLEFLDHFLSETRMALEVLREDTQQALEIGDVSDRIHIVNTLKIQLRKVGSHLKAEMEECREAAAGLSNSEGKHTVEALERRIDEVFEQGRKEIRSLAQEFGL